MSENNQNLLSNLFSGFGEDISIPVTKDRVINMDDLDESARQQFENELNTGSAEKKNSYWDYFSWLPFISKTINIDDKSNTIIKNASSMLTEAKKNISDPLTIAGLISASLFIFFYFANELVYQIIGLYYPCYYLYTLIHYRHAQKANKIKSIMKYFIIYGHMELLACIVELFGFYLHHPKIVIILSLLYMAGYKQLWLDNLYDKVIFYDKIILGFIYLAFDKFCHTYSAVSSSIGKEKK